MTEKTRTISDIISEFKSNENKVTKITMREKIKTMSEVELDQFILARLKFDGTYDEDGRPNHLRFDMSGYYGQDFSTFIENREIWDLFIDCGIYDRVSLFHFDTYKGCVTLAYKWFHDDTEFYNTTGITEINVIEFNGSGTREIIKYVLKFFCIDNQDKWERRLD
jgi:hypothetical protein